MALNFSALDALVAQNPVQPFPLDKRSYFESYAEAQIAASRAVEAGVQSDYNYYYGQTLCVYTKAVEADPENNIEAIPASAKLYIIQPDNTLSEAGASYDDTELRELIAAKGVLDSVTGKEAISVTTTNNEAEVKLLIDNASSSAEGGTAVKLSQSNAGLKAEVDLGDYALASEIPDESDFGILGLKTTSVGTIAIDTGKEGSTQEPNIAFNIADGSKAGNVVLSDTQYGLKADIDLSAYRLIADDENTAHTHSTKVKSGIKANGTGDLTGDTTFELNVGFDFNATTKLITLYDKDDNAKTALASLDATAFIKDGMISSVELVAENDKKEAGQFLKITWNTDAGKDVVYLNVTRLVDVYTPAAGATEVQVAISDEKVVSATLVNNGVTTAKIADANVTKAKLASSVQTSLDKADTALQAADKTELSNAINALAGTGRTTETVKDNADAIAVINNASTGILATAKTYTDDEIKKLDVTVTGMGAGKTIATLTETDGKIAATFQDIAITKSQITGFSDDDYAKPSDLNNTIVSVERRLETSGIPNVGSNGQINETDVGSVDTPLYITTKNGVATLTDTHALAGGEGIQLSITASSFDNTTTKIRVADKGITTAKIADHAVGAAQLKAEKGYTGTDAEVWILDCGGAE